MTDRQTDREKGEKGERDGEEGKRENERERERNWLLGGYHARLLALKVSTKTGWLSFSILTGWNSKLDLQLLSQCGSAYSWLGTACPRIDKLGILFGSKTQWQHLSNDCSFSPTCKGVGSNLMCTNCSTGYTGTRCERSVLSSAYLCLTL